MATRRTCSAATRPAASLLRAGRMARAHSPGIREPGRACSRSVAAHSSVDMRSLPSWLLLSLGSAFFAGLTPILGKVGLAGLNSNLATLIRTGVVLVRTLGIVSARSEWALPKEGAVKPMVFLVLSGVATGLSWLCYYRALQLAPA